MDIPNFFSDKQTILNFDYSQIENYINTSIDHSFFIPNLTPINPDKPSVHRLRQTLLTDYYKSILQGYNHIYISKLLHQLNNPSANICLPLLNNWNEEVSIDNLVIINNPKDAEKISKNHVKKAPIFKELLNTSIISTTDNDDWQTQRGEMNPAFIPALSLKKIFPESVNRAKICSELLIKMSDSYSEPVNMSEFFLNETQAQLQKAMFGFSDEFEQRSNKRIRNVFAGIDVDYLETFTNEALKETKISNGPASKYFQSSDDIEKNIGNIILFAFAGHDTTGHTLTWLLYELGKHPHFKNQLINEIDEYWKNNKEENYDTFDQLPFMTKCITETLRMWPALANGTYRELEFDETIHGINGEEIILEKGTYCQIMNWTRHRNPELWIDPDIFNPNRQFKNEEIWDYKGFGSYNVQSDRFSPFTYGPRNCLGKNFSHMEMRLILLNIFKDHDFTLSKKQAETVDDPRYLGINTFTMGPADIHGGLIGMYMNLHLRKSKL